MCQECIKKSIEDMCDKIKNNSMDMFGIPASYIFSTESKTLDFKKLMPWQRQILINTLVSDKHIPAKRKLEIMRGHRKEIPTPPIPRGQSIRGQRAEMIIYDCSVGCDYVDKCNRGKECPYDEED